MTLKTISLLLAVILVTYLTVCQTEQGGCPEDWDEVRGQCFRFITPHDKVKSTFEDAKKICNDIKVTCPGQQGDVNGALARIPCPKIQEQLVDLAKEKDLREDFFIGLTVDGKGKESWISGGKYVFYKFWANMDDDRANKQAVMSFSDCPNYGKWKPVDNNDTAYCLCMLPCVVENIEG